MKELKLLIVEDTEDLIFSYERDIKSFNLASEVKIIPLIVKEKDQAISILKDKVQYFDAAIVDLKLDKNGLPDEDYSGNEVLREIKGNLRFPVFIITGTPNQLAEDIRQENSFFKLKPRGEEDNYLEQLVYFQQFKGSNAQAIDRDVKIPDTSVNTLYRQLMWMRQRRQEEEREKEQRSKGF